MPPVPRQTPVGSSRRFAHLSLRLLLLLIGMFTAALGVALTTVADLGTTPISTVPYVFTVLTGYSFGTTTFFREHFSGCGSGAGSFVGGFRSGIFCKYRLFSFLASVLTWRWRLFRRMHRPDGGRAS